MAPKVRNVDEQRLDGAYVYVIGGVPWVAPEPTMDTLRAVQAVEIENVQEARRRLAEARLEDDESPGEEQSPADGEEAVGELERVREALQGRLRDVEEGIVETTAMADARIPQLRLLLFAGDEEGRYRQAKYASPPKSAKGDARAGELKVGEPCGEHERLAIPEPWAYYHLSVKRASAIYREVMGLGEEEEAE